MLKELLKEKQMSAYALSKKTGIPESTISDMCRGKTPVEKWSSEHLYKVASVLECSMDELYEKCQIKEDFDVFRSKVCHWVKYEGEISFLIEVLEKDMISDYYQQKKYLYALYMLAMVDYLSRRNHIDLCNKYNHLRTIKMKNIVFPKSVLLLSKNPKNHTMKETLFQKSIPEFKRHNIVENEVFDIA